MKKHLLRVLSLLFILTLCLPLVACDMEFGGLIGELMESANSPEGEQLLDDILTNSPVEVIIPDEQTSIDVDWDNWIEEAESATAPDDIPEPDHIVDLPETTGEPTYDMTTAPPEPEIVPVILFVSFDELFTETQGARQDVFFPGNALSWNSLAYVDNYKAQTMTARGWVALSSQELGDIGYQIDDQEPVYNADFWRETEQIVIDVAHDLGGKSASRFAVDIPIRELSDEHTIKILVRNADGVVEELQVFTLHKAKDYLTTFMETWIVSGISPEIVPDQGHSNSAMVAAGGVERGALLHQGSVYIGDFDLGEYSKIVVYYGLDNSEVMHDLYNANPNNRIMITSKDNKQFSPEQSTVIASTQYTLEGWNLVPIEIDLSGIDYKGPVYITWDTLPASFMLIGRIDLKLPD